ncbi:unnamed protein product [Chrysoparadoxa australica]
MQDFINAVINALTNGNPDHLLIVVLGLVALFGLIYSLGGRYWAFLYVAIIPFLKR